MPRVKAKKKTIRRKPESQSYQVGLPDVPPTYGLKTKRFLPFSHAERRLAESRNYWICTARPDGRPHSIPVWGFWFDGALYFGTGRSSRKAQNLQNNPAVSIHLESGNDVVILEGTAVEVDVTDRATIKKLDAASRSKYNMPIMVTPEVALYAVSPRKVLAWTEKDFPNNATRWLFATNKA